MPAHDEPGTSDDLKLLLSLISHDLRNPINVISLTTDVLESLREPPAGRPELLGRLRRNVGKLDRLAGEIADYVRARFAGGLPVTVESMSVGAVCRRVADRLAAAHPERPRIEVAVDDAADGTWDPERLEQAVGYLAEHALEQGGDPITLRCRRDSDAVEVSVHDSGPAIASEPLAALFEPARTPRKEPGRGASGVGLFLAREIARAHGGDATARSSEAEGTTLTLRIPANAG